MIQEKNKNHPFIGGCQKQGCSLSVRKSVRKKYTVNHRKYEAAMKTELKIKIKLNYYNNERKPDLYVNHETREPHAL